MKKILCILIILILTFLSYLSIAADPIRALFTAIVSIVIGAIFLISLYLIDK
jgi:hypothetical protein